MSADDFFLIKDNILIQYTSDSFSEVTVPEGITGIGPEAFADHRELTSIKLPYSLTHIGKTAFKNCINLRRIQMIHIDKADSLLQEIEDNAFEGCRLLTRIAIPDSVRYIHSEVFKDCSSLKCINIPSALEHIGQDCFSGCSSLDNFQFPLSLYLKLQDSD